MRCPQRTPLNHYRQAPADLDETVSIRLRRASCLRLRKAAETLARKTNATVSYSDAIDWLTSKKREEGFLP